MTTRAIILALRRHSDRAMIVSTYTCEQGRVDMLYFGAQGRRHGVGVLRPMAEVELTVDENSLASSCGGRAWPRVKEVSLLHDIPDGPKAAMTALVMAEIAEVSLREPVRDDEVYHLLAQAMTMSLREYMHRLSVALGYGGEPLEEWQGLNSPAIYGEMID